MTIRRPDPDLTMFDTTGSETWFLRASSPCHLEAWYFLLYTFLPEESRWSKTRKSRICENSSLANNSFKEAVKIGKSLPFPSPLSNSFFLLQ